MQGVEISHNGQDGITMIICGQLTASRLLVHHNHDNGIQLTNTSLNAHNLTVSSNGTQGLPSVGSGIFSAGATIIMTSTIVDRNILYGLYMQTGSGFLSYDDFFSNPSGNVVGPYPGVGCLELNPLYVSLPQENFNLLEGSPCIDTGNPGDPLDPDDTRTDMGALYFNQSAVAPRPSIQAPRDFRIESVSPNPFNSTTVVSYALRVGNRVRLTAWDTAGRLAATLVDDWRFAGEYRAVLDGTKMTSGTYFLRLEAGDFSDVASCTLVK